MRITPRTSGGWYFYLAVGRRVLVIGDRAAALAALAEEDGDV